MDAKKGEQIYFWVTRMPYKLLYDTSWCSGVDKSYFFTDL